MGTNAKVQSVNSSRMRPILGWFLAVAQLWSGGSRAAEIVVGIEAGHLFPDNVAVSVGDTVTWVWGPGDGEDVGSYAGDWQSPTLNDWASFSVLFKLPGVEAYRVRWYGEGTNQLLGTRETDAGCVGFTRPEGGIPGIAFGPVPGIGFA